MDKTGAQALIFRCALCWHHGGTLKNEGKGVVILKVCADEVGCGTRRRELPLNKMQEVDRMRAQVLGGGKP